MRTPLLVALAGAWLAVSGIGCATSRHARKPETLEFELRDLEGRTSAARDYRGRVILVDLWATWCRPCAASMPFYADLHQRYQAQGFSVVAISVDEHEEDVLRFVSQRRLPFPILCDPKGSIPAMIDLDTMPSSILIDRQGRVLDVHSGFADADRPMIEAQVKEALERPPQSQERPVATAL